MIKKLKQWLCKHKHKELKSGLCADNTRMIATNFECEKCGLKTHTLEAI